MRQAGFRVAALALAASLATPPHSAQAQSAADLAALRAQIEALQQIVVQQSAALEAQNTRLAEIEAAAARTPAAAQAARADAAEDAPPTVSRASGMESVRGARLQIYGQVNRGVLFGDNGTNSRAFFVDNNAGSTRFGLIGETDVEGTTVGANIEVELISNNSNAAPSNPTAFGPDDGSFALRERRLEVYARNPDFGQLWLGQGSTAADGVQEIDLGGTAIGGGYSDINTLAGALRFGQERGGRVVRVRDVFSNLDRGRDDRIRYDTPSFLGFTASGSVADESEVDLALRWSGDFGGGLRAAAGAFVAFPDGVDSQYGGSGSIAYQGVSLTLAAAVQDADDERDPLNLYGKLGYDFDIISNGRTSVAADYSYSEDIRVAGDEGSSVGLFAVQRLNRTAADVYLGYRFYGLDADAAGFDDIHAVLTGVRVRF